MEIVKQVNSAVNSFVWGPVMLVFIVGTGIYFSTRLRFFQVTRIGLWWQKTIASLFRKRDKTRSTTDGAITPFQALTTALAATVGTGNIVGVATAIVLGGPGAIFWMWISAFFGMMTKYSEIVLAIRFRKRNQEGDWVGGPMYYISEGLGKNFKWLASIFAVFGALAAFGIGNMTQINSIVDSVESTLLDFGVAAAARPETGIPVFRLCVGLVLALTAALVVIGGMKRIASVTEKLVPFMNCVFILGGIAALVINRSNLGSAFSAILTGAFSMRAVGSGVLGYVVFQAIRFGVARGVFSNEAGLGSAPIAHAAADTESPVEQGMWGVFEVFVDTLIICTFTGLIILTSGIEGVLDIGVHPGLEGAQLTMAAFRQTFGLAGSALLTVAIALFAFSTALSWSLYGQRCFEYLLGGKGVRVYQVVFVSCMLIASCIELGLAWDIADTLNGLMAIPNLVALVLLSPVVVKLTKEYLAKKKEH